MLERLRAARKNQNGFTLIELLIVIVILGVLAGIVVFTVNGINDRGVTAACETDKRTITTAVEAYYAKEASYPTGADNAARLAVLKTALLIKEVPSSDSYGILLDASGNVTAQKLTNGAPNGTAAC